ncbi:MAG: hypothetical protein GX970_11850 [Phyllobacteriaceae bacterium]|nr:hypothetical protein [Phyllobacteriaceae bacterium]
MRQVAWVFATSALLCIDAVAQPFVAAQDGAKSCWQRIYDAEHLRTHPDQQVTEVTFGMGYFEEGYEDEGATAYTLFGLHAALRDGRHGSAGGGCWTDDKGVMTCSVDCDGGGVKLHDRDNGSLLLDLEATGGIRLMECGSEAEDDSFFTLEPGLDDKQFLVHPVAVKVCKGLIPDWD